MNDVQMFWSLCAECVEFLSQMRRWAVLMESTQGEDQTDKQGLYQRKRSDRVVICGLGWYQSTFKSRENTAMSSAIFCLAVCVFDMVNKAVIWIVSVYYVMNQPFFSSSFLNSEPAWLRRENLKIYVKQKWRMLYTCWYNNRMQNALLSPLREITVSI